MIIAEKAYNLPERALLDWESVVNYLKIIVMGMMSRISLFANKRKNKIPRKPRKNRSPDRGANKGSRNKRRPGRIPHNN